MKIKYLFTFALGLHYFSHLLTRTHSLPTTMADCAADCPNPSNTTTGSSYFAGLPYNATNCNALLGLCHILMRSTPPYSDLLAIVDHDGTQACEKYRTNVSASGLPSIVINTIENGPGQQSQNGIISGTITPILLANGRNLGVYNTESFAVNAASFAKNNNDCEGKAFTSSWQKFFECIGPRTTGMPTTVLMAIRYAAFTTFPDLGRYLAFQAAAESYLYALQVQSMVQSGGTAWEYTAQATIYPQTYNGVIGSARCNPTLRNSDDMLAQNQSGCPVISDTVKTTPAIVSQVPNTMPICGLSAFDAPDTCVSDGAGKGLSLQFNCETYGLCNTFFFGNSNGDLYPANYTLYLKAIGVLNETAVFIHNNPGICAQLRTVYNQTFQGNVPCYDIIDSPSELDITLLFTPDNIALLLANYDALVAENSASSSSSSSQTNSFTNSGWAFFLYGAVSMLMLFACMVLAYMINKITDCTYRVKNYFSACGMGLFQGNSASTSVQYSPLLPNKEGSNKPIS